LHHPNIDRTGEIKNEKDGVNMKISKKKLEIAMATKQYSSEQLAKVTGLSPITIARIKNGVQDARQQTIGKIASALGVPVAALMESEGVQ